jgi:acyl dehydratase
MAHVDKGLYLEEFEIGKVYESPARTITETDVVNFAGLSGDFNPLHTDEEFAKANAFGKRIAHGALGVAISTGLSNQLGIFEGTTIAFMQFTAIYKSPLCIGDTVHLEMIPTEIIPGKKPGRGILKMDTRLVNQDGVLITESPWTLLMKSKN